MVIIKSIHRLRWCEDPSLDQPNLSAQVHVLGTVGKDARPQTLHLRLIIPFLFFGWMEWTTDVRSIKLWIRFLLISGEELQVLKERSGLITW